MAPILAAEAQPHLPILLVIGFAIFVGTIGARIFQRLRVPQVVGYIAIGVVVGRSGLGFIDEAAIKALLPFNFFALGVIGFMIGGELRKEVLQKHGRQFLTILLSEGLTAFAVVSIFTGGVALLVTGDLAVSAALGLVFGAISSATAPAATVNVLWEYKARGPVTRTVYAIVALDDSLALVLYALTFSVALRLVGASSSGVLGMLGQVARELGGAVVLGTATALLMNFILRRVRDPERALALTIGTLALVLGGALVLKFDLILTAMALGAALVNFAPRRSQEAFQVVSRFASPIYVLFFVVVGARLSLSGMDPWMWTLTAPFFVGRIGAKIAGAHLGARWAAAPATVRKYLGVCLFCQGGVAIGLSILASARFAAEVPGARGEQLGHAIIMIVTATTFLMEMIGPPAVKWAIQRAGEAGLDVTEDDLMQTYKVGKVTDRASPKFLESTTVADILHTIAETDAMCYPVTNAEGRLTGVIRLPELKQSFATAALQEWLVALDVMQPVPDTVGEDAPLAEAVTRMREQHLEYLPVVEAEDDGAFVGMLELRAVQRALTREVLRRHQLADADEA